MKSILTIVVVLLALMSPTLYAGSATELAVLIDFDDEFARGAMWPVRSSENDVESIGCSYKGHVNPVHFDYFPWKQSVKQWAWCRAKDADGVQVWCYTKNPDLLDALQAISPFSYIRFKFTNLDEENVGECTEFSFSTTSRHLPNFTTKK